MWSRPARSLAPVASCAYGRLMSNDRDSNGKGPAWLTTAIMFAVIGSIVSFTAILIAIYLLRQ
jgi:hypothetical protein